jgi:hypothetical protein
MSFLVFILLVLPLQSKQAQNSAPAEMVCGTINTAFTEGRCIHITFSGEVSGDKNFDRPFGPLRFRLNSEQALGGWCIEVVPAEQTNSGNDEYVWVVTPPYHFGNIRYLDTPTARLQRMQSEGRGILTLCSIRDSSVAQRTW